MNFWLCQTHFTQANIPSDIFIFGKEHEVVTSKWGVELLCTTQQRSVTKTIPVCVMWCMSALLCVSLPVARLLPPLRLSCAQTDGSPTAAPAHCFNMFWQRKLYHSSRRPSAARSTKLKCASWSWSFGCCSWLITKAIWPTGGFDRSSRPDVFYIKKERKGHLYRF